MKNEHVSKFGIVDYCLFAGVLILSSGIGLIMSYIGNKSPEEFLMGNRSFKPLPVSMSLLTSFVASIALIGYPGEAYANGMQFSMISIGVIGAIIFSVYFILPMLYSLKLTSVNEYIEIRFRSQRLCLIISLLTILKNLIISGICLYAPTIVLASITKLSTLTNILLLGIICTLYSSFGGIRAVIWTDVFQLLVMLIGLITIMMVGIFQNGGVIETLYTASKGERLQFFNMNLSPFERHTFFNTIVFGFFTYAPLYGSDQVNLQRICTVKSIKYAQKVLLYNIFGMILIYILLFSGGLVAYATYAGCDPMALGIINRKEEIIPYFVMDKLTFIPGFPGILVATIIGGSLSTVSSWINGCVAMIWRDVCLRFIYFKASSPTMATFFNKIISLIVGSVVIGVAIISSNAGNLLELTLSILSALNSPVFGVFMIGYFLPKCNIKGVWVGFILSSALTIWIAVGGLFYKRNPSMLPFSSDQCGLSNISLPNITRIEKFTLFINDSMEDTSANQSFIISLYQISYTLYGVIGTLLCILSAVVVSFITGNHDIQEISQTFVSHKIRKFYWTKEEISKFEETEIKLNCFNLNVKEDNNENSVERLKTFEDF